MWHSYCNAVGLQINPEFDKRQDLFLLRCTTLQSFSYPPLSFSMPVWTMCPTGTSRSLAHRRCSRSRASSPEDWHKYTHLRVCHWFLVYFSSFICYLNQNGSTADCACTHKKCSWVKLPVHTMSRQIITITVQNI